MMTIYDRLRCLIIQPTDKAILSTSPISPVPPDYKRILRSGQFQNSGGIPEDQAVYQ